MTCQESFYLFLYFFERVVEITLELKKERGSEEFCGMEGGGVG